MSNPETILSVGFGKQGWEPGCKFRLDVFYTRFDTYEFFVFDMDACEATEVMDPMRQSDTMLDAIAGLGVSKPATVELVRLVQAALEDHQPTADCPGCEGPMHPQAADCGACPV